MKPTESEEITTALTVDSICYAASVVDQKIEKDIIALVERQDSQSRKDERRKIAEQIKNMEISDITTAESIYNAIMKGPR